MFKVTSFLYTYEYIHSILWTWSAIYGHNWLISFAVFNASGSCAPHCMALVTERALISFVSSASLGFCTWMRHARKRCLRATLTSGVSVNCLLAWTTGTGLCILACLNYECRLCYYVMPNIHGGKGIGREAVFGGEKGSETRLIGLTDRGICRWWMVWNKVQPCTWTRRLIFFCLGNCVCFLHQADWAHKQHVYIKQHLVYLQTATKASDSQTVFEADALSMHSN